MPVSHFRNILPFFLKPAIQLLTHWYECFSTYTALQTGGSYFTGHNSHVCLCKLDVTHQINITHHHWWMSSYLLYWLMAVNKANIDACIVQCPHTLGLLAYKCDKVVVQLSNLQLVTCSSIALWLLSITEIVCTRCENFFLQHIWQQCACLCRGDL